jgi:hypothetical protein
MEEVSLTGLQYGHIAQKMWKNVYSITTAAYTAGVYVMCGGRDENEKKGHEPTPHSMEQRSLPVLS